MVKNSRITRAEEDAQHPAPLSSETVGEIVRQGRGVAVLLGVNLQPTGYPAPVEVGHL